MLQEYGNDGSLLFAIKSLYRHPEVSVRVSGKQSTSLHKTVGLRHGCTRISLTV